MRLLEFNRDEGGANPQHLPTANKLSKPATRAATAPQKKSALASAHPRARVFPVKTNTTRKPVRHSPIDLEQLQQRIVALELHMRERAERRGEQIPASELEQLKQRMKLLERSLNTELWAARQREYTMLQLLSRPSLKARLRKQLMHIRKHQLPAIGNWLKTEGREWWQHSQPNWWPKFARAWQESLEQARR